MRVFAQRQTPPRKPKPLRACSNAQWCVLYVRNCDKTDGTYQGPELALCHENRPVRLLSITPLEDATICRHWRVCVEEKMSGERWCLTITPSSVSASVLPELQPA